MLDLMNSAFQVATTDYLAGRGNAPTREEFNEVLNSCVDALKQDAAPNEKIRAAAIEHLQSKIEDLNMNWRLTDLKSNLEGPILTSPRGGERYARGRRFCPSRQGAL